MKIKKFCCAVFLMMLLCCSVFATTRSELKRMSEFVTGFIELDYYNFDSRTITMGELLKFGIWHNYMHNWDSDRKLIEQVENDSYNCAVSAKNVEAAVRKYFALQKRNVLFQCS